MCASSLIFVEFLDWWNGFNRLPLIDIRESQENGSLYANDTVIVHLPFSTLLSGERSCELPPRHVKFAVLIDEAQTNLVETTQFFGRTTSQATLQSRKPWLVEQAILVNEDLWMTVRKLGIFVDSCIEHSTSDPFRPLSRLWQPDPIIPELLWPLLKPKLLKLKQIDVPLEIWDLGSGAGRDITFLAEQIKVEGMTNIHIVGVDNHKGSADRCLPFWRHRGVADVTRHILLDLNKVTKLEEALGDKCVVCIYAVRFWNPRMIRWLATNARLNPNTLFAISHFCKTGPTWDFDHPKESRVLQREELANIFSADWEILHDRIAFDGDHGRTLIHFVARKR